MYPTVRKSIVLLSFVLFLVSCGTIEPTPTPIAQLNEPTAVSPTNTAEPTATLVPTETETAVPTIAPTELPTTEPTATHTNTPMPTETPTEIPTTAPTELPPPTEPPPTAAFTPTSPPAVAPPPAPAPTGANLLINPGFEAGTDNWSGGIIYESGAKPYFVHSGQFANAVLYGRIYQNYQNAQPGTTYRAGSWVKIWSSTGEDRTISENPSNFLVRICINVNGDDDPNLDTTICSSWVQPFDVWQYISVDAVAENSRITIMLQSGFGNGNRTKNNESIWDDAALGVAPSAATATPLPAAPPSRPAAVPFDAVSLRDNMNQLRSNIEQMGGLLDRLYNGEAGKCTEYMGYYDNIILSPVFDSVPDDWHAVYNEYIFAAESTINTSQPIKELCVGGGGALSSLNYGVARSGINDSLNRLIPAIDAANTLLGQ